VCNVNLPHYRPLINSNAAAVNENLIVVMEECWVEDPKARPDFNAISTLFTSFTKHKLAPLSAHSLHFCGLVVK